MAWVLIDDEFYDHPKWRTAPGDSIAMWVAAIAWCNRSEEWSGAIPTNKLAGLVKVRNPKATIADLEQRKAMYRAGDCHVIHEFDQWQQIARRKAISEARSAAGKRGAAARWNDGKPDGNDDGNCHVPSDAQPPTTNNRVQVLNNSTPENTPPGVDNSRRSQVLDAYCRAELTASRAKGAVIGNEAKYIDAIRRRATMNPDLDRWLDMFPDAQPTAVAAWLTGDKHSMQYQRRADELAEVHYLPGAETA